MKRIKYDKEFKIEAVKMASDSKYSVKEVADELSIGANTLRRWLNEYDEYGEDAFPGQGKALFNATYEIKKLQKENVALREENELLKKLRAFLMRKNA